MMCRGQFISDKTGGEAYEPVEVLTEEIQDFQSTLHVLVPFWPGLEGKQKDKWLHRPYRGTDKDTYQVPVLCAVPLGCERKRSYHAAPLFPWEPQDQCHHQYRPYG